MADPVTLLYIVRYMYVLVCMVQMLTSTTRHAPFRCISALYASCKNKYIHIHAENGVLYLYMRFCVVLGKHII